MARWEKSFIRRRQKEKEALLALQRDATTNDSIRMAVEGCLMATVDVFELLLHIAKKPEYRSRVTIILYGKGQPAAVTPAPAAAVTPAPAAAVTPAPAAPVAPAPAPVAPAPAPVAPAPSVAAALATDTIGRHWIAYSGTLPTHKMSRSFDTKSIGYQVLTEQIASPHFTTGDDAKSKGQDRGQQEYRPFFTFRLNNCAILALDWPTDLQKSDDFLIEARDFYQDEVCPLLQVLLNHWDGDLENEVSLELV